MEIFDYDNILLLPRKCRVEALANPGHRIHALASELLSLIHI